MELGRVISVRLLQPLNALIPMVVTELGIVIPVSLLQSEKAPPPIVVTENVFRRQLLLMEVVHDGLRRKSGNIAKNSSHEIR